MCTALKRKQFFYFSKHNTYGIVLMRIRRQGSSLRSERLPYQKQIPDGDSLLKRSIIDYILVNNSNLSSYDGSSSFQPTL
ncbi:MAG: hypothetical protein SOZ18_05170 [Phocaeicola sp.]|nr:hypothetical protein [Phocaeicola sp.]